MTVDEMSFLCFFCFQKLLHRAAKSLGKTENASGLRMGDILLALFVLLDRAERYA